MADRTSAQSFSNIFVMLAKRYNDLIKQGGLARRAEVLGIAKEIWTLSRECDFSPEQMGCDDSLHTLDLFDGLGTYADY